MIYEIFFYYKTYKYKSWEENVTPISRLQNIYFKLNYTAYKIILFKMQLKTPSSGLHEVFKGISPMCWILHSLKHYKICFFKL
jgi:hypothetical protein